MSTALAVCHGSFGRVTVYRLDKPIRTHAHREGHLTFLLSGPPAIVTIADVPHLVDQAAGVAINPWQPHSFQPCSDDKPSVVLVAYICDEWLDRDHDGRGSLRFGANELRVGTTLCSICASLAHALVSNAGFRIVNRYLNQLFDASFDEVLEDQTPTQSKVAAAAPDRLPRSQIAAHFGRYLYRGYRTRHCGSRRWAVAPAFLQAVPREHRGNPGTLRKHDAHRAGA